MHITDIHSFLAYYGRIKDRTRALFPLIPPEQIEWTYKAGKFTFGDQIRHLALIERYLYVENVHHRPSRYQGCGTDWANGLPATLALYEDLHRESRGLLGALTPEDLQQTCALPGGHPIRIWKVLRAMVEHEIHHRAAIYTYLGMLGIETPPIFGMTSEEVIERGTQGDDPSS